MARSKRASLVRQARRYGYYLSGTTLWNHCPLCRNKVETQRVRGAVTSQLDAAMTDHLKYEHPDS